MIKLGATQEQVKRHEQVINEITNKSGTCYVKQPMDKACTSHEKSMNKSEVAYTVLCSTMLTKPAAAL